MGHAAHKVSRYGDRLSVYSTVIQNKCDIFDDYREMQRFRIMGIQKRYPYKVQQIHPIDKVAAYEVAAYKVAAYKVAA